ncbi:DUF4394 domain-containing protein [Pedobacter caeni]|uniref:DUF4394 domain-containing protein n=1 Tax=Pedobacter caeni TaxID=288992 RepID=A0A1M5M7E4_9SPHI|nr:DUF4394 domain-containing protein [Pedobacter caeni]SHG73160.1 protein of unknown function [Pedobacter caeni]
MKNLNLRDFRLPKMLLILFLLGAMSSCKKDRNNNPDPEQPLSGPDQEFYALSNNNLLKFNAKDVSKSISSVSISGLPASEKMLSIDFRPATGELYGVSNASKLYVIRLNGSARAIGTGFSPSINGTTASIDFNPTVDRIRLISNTGQNLRLHPETGMVAASDGNINGVSNAIVSGAAYTNNKAGASSTTLFDIDITSKKLYKQDPPNDGKLIEIGSLGLEIGSSSSFDISPDNTKALVAGTMNGTSSIYSINLETGKATLAGRFPASGPIEGIAIPTDPVAYATDNANNFLIFNPMSPAALVSKPITGLASLESIVGIDFRPANGQIYALSSSSRLYTVNAATGALTPVGSGTLTTLLLGNSFGFDFNPTVDRIRIVSNTGQNLRLHPETGAVVFIDGILKPGSPSISAAAYTNNFLGATETTLFDIDHTTDKLYKQTPPNEGTLIEIGSLGINVESTNGFDIGSTSGIAYAILSVGGSNKIYTINLSTGAASAISDFPKTITAMTVGLGL